MEPEFYINNESIGNFFSIGRKPDFSFYEKAAKFLDGSETITFKVGENTITNEVSLNGLRYKVNNNFSSLDIRSFVEAERVRIRKIQETANFSDDLTDVYFVPSDVLLSWESHFLPFDKSFLIKDPPGQKFFVSHSWLSIDHPDRNGDHLKLLQKHALDVDKNSFYWIDYCCLPQEPRNHQDKKLFLETLPRICSIQSKCSTLIIAEENYSERMWCHMEHFGGLLFSLNNIGSIVREMNYLKSDTTEIYQNMLNQVQTLKEPDWENLKVTNENDIPGIKYNYEFLSNISKFQLYDRFSDLRRSLPGFEYYSGHHYNQSAFGINHSVSFSQLQSLFTDFGGNMEYFHKEQSLLWLARRFSWSVFPDDYNIDELEFNPWLFHSIEMVGWIALLLAIIKSTNKGNNRIFNFREEYCKIILMSLFK